VSYDLLLAGRISLMVISLIVIFFIIKAKNDQRLGNQFFIVIMIFWMGTFAIALKPDILEPVLNTTGFVNRAQFLLIVSIIIILYLLYQQSRQRKSISYSFNQTIRKIALDYFLREFNQVEINNSEIVIVIVAKNESETIGKVIDGIKSQTISEPYTILVVNDGSTDNTEKIAKEKGALVVNHYYNLGIGAANKTGYLASRLFNPKIIVNIDSDGQHDPKYIPEIISKIKKENADLVIASRFARESNYKTTIVRSVGNRFYTRLVNWIAKISLTDVTSGYRGIKFEKLSSIFFIAETNFAIELGIRAGKSGLKIIEIPVISKSRERGESQFHRIENFLVYNWNALVQIFNALYRKVEFYKNHMRLEK